MYSGIFLKKMPTSQMLDTWH